MAGSSFSFCPADRGEVRYVASTDRGGSLYFWEYVVHPGLTPKFS